MDDSPKKAETHKDLESDLKGLVYRGSTWLVAGTVSQRIVRLMSNLILVRVLLPEDFGLVALVFAWVQGLVLCSDLGVMRSIIQHPHGDSREFLGTAFTLNILRGIGLWLVSMVISVPMAAFYEMEELKWMLPVASLSVLINALSSPRQVLLTRNLKVRLTEGISVASSLSGVLFTESLALLWRDAWALIFGGLCRDVFRCVLSYFVSPPRGIWPSWDKNAFKAILNFGRWIVLSSFLTFLALQADRLIAGKFVPQSVLGQLSVALLYVGMVRSLVSTGGKSLLLPIFAKTEGTVPERLLPRYRKARLVMLSTLIPLLCGMTILGPELIDLLYPERWAAVGFYLQCTIVGYLPSYILTGTGMVLLSIGDSKGNAMVTAVEVVSLVLSLLVGVLTWGLPGMLVARGISTFVSYPILASRLKRRGIWMPWLDLIALVLTILALLGGFYLKRGYLS
ncbi:MAG: oligosaccharide flippase family protein [Planctomycetes bacterium]|nr:oligosaccharide flippase family protein [Planctomycetota bacterium]